MPKNALCLCGGGLRGVIPSCVLIELEKQTGKLTREIFDCVSGTSTGALIAAAVAVGLPAKRILDIYIKRSKEIFRHGGLSLPLQVVRGYSDDSENIWRVLTSEFGEHTSTWKMNDCPLKVVICATGMNGHPWFFVPGNPKNSGKTGNVSLIGAACASAAAPLYFDPFKVPIDGKVIPLYDGGVSGTANPAYQTAVELFYYDDRFTPAETRMVTLGTGFYPAKDDTAPPAGLLAEISWTVDTLVDGSVDWVDKAVDRQWPGLATKLNMQLPRPIGMADIGAIPEIVALARTWAAGIDWVKLLEQKKGNECLSST